MLDSLRDAVCAANLDVVRAGLVTLTWGNVSGIDRDRGLVAIKPSGVAYDRLTPRDIVIVDLEGRKVEGDWNPSSDTPTHVRLYRAFSTIGGITHTHSVHATSFAQASREIPCLGTTHADHFHGPVPLARSLTPEEVAEDYEGNTGVVIVERFQELDPDEAPGVLVEHHGPFAWGGDAAASVRNAIALETIAEMAIATFALRPEAGPIPAHILEKHYRRKHGPDAYYGQR